MNRKDDTHELVQNAYADVARKQSSCCGPSSSCCGEAKPYTVPDHPVPEAELGLSCGNPLAFGHINKGDVVLNRPLPESARNDAGLHAARIAGALLT
jgi:hypothetical protein